MIYIPYEDYCQAAKSLDSSRLNIQCIQVLDLLNHISQHGHMFGWDMSTRCDLATLGLYCCAEMSSRGFTHGFEYDRMKAAWLHLRRPGKLRQRPKRDEAVYHSFRQLLVWEEPEYYEEVFDMIYIPFKPVTPW